MERDKAPCHEREPRHGRGAAGREADEPGRDRDDPGRRRGQGAEEGAHGRVLPQQSGLGHEHERHEKAGHRERECGQPGAHRVRGGQTRPGVGGEADRWRDVGDDAEVEHEQVCGEHGHVELEQDRRGDRGGDDVVGGGGQAHSEHQARQHGERQREGEPAHGQVEDAAREFAAEPGARDGARDDPGTGARGDHGQGRAGSAFEQAGEFGRARAGVGPHEAHRQRGENAEQRGVGGGAPGEQQADDHREGSEEVGAGEQGTHGGQRLARGSEHAGAACLAVHAREQAEVVQRGRDHGEQDDLVVRGAGVLGHDEHGRAHDRRHELPSGGGRRLGRSREPGTEPRPLHHRDRERARGHGVGHRASRDHALHAARHDRRLGRATGVAAREAEGQVVEEAADSGPHQHYAEEQEQEDEGGRHLDRGAEHRRRGVDGFADQQLEGEAGVVEDRHRGAEVAVGQGGQRDHHDRQSDAAPGGFQNQRQRGGGEHDVERLVAQDDRLGGQALVVHEDVPRGPQRQPAEHDVVRRDARPARSRPAGGVEQVDQAHRGAHVHRALQQGGQRAEQGGVELERGEAAREHRHDPPPRAEPRPVPALPVVLRGGTVRLDGSHRVAHRLTRSLCVPPCGTSQSSRPCSRK